MTRIEGGLVDRELTESVIGAFYEVYRTLGYGFLEAVYCNALNVELRLRGHETVREVGIAVSYKNVGVGRYRADMIVEKRVLIEVKASAVITVADHRQVMNYQRATRIPVAFLFHFGPEPKFHRTVLTR